MLISEGKRFYLMVLFWNWILGWLGLNVFAQVQPDCDFSYYLRFGEQQILQSPNFDWGSYYPPNKVCRWTYNSPPGTTFDVTCSPIDIPGKDSWTNQCQQDRLVVSLTGNPTFGDGTNFCGQGSFKLTSVANSLTIGLYSAPNSPGGRYQCIITPLVAGGTPPTTTTTTSTTTPRPNGCDCGWRQQRRIVGGTETKVNEYAFMAAIIDINRQTLWCGATIISSRYSVTAAHCFANSDANSQYGLLVGDHNLEEATETNSAKLYRVQYYRMHQSYSSRTQQNDIAIVRTTETIAFSMNVGPICLPYRYTTLDFTKATVTALGWGSLFFTGPTSDSLQAVNLTVVSRSTCQSSYKEPNEIVYDSQICTYAANKDACTFDSGGPIVWFDTYNTFRYQFLGIISYGKACATNAPAINTRVTNYISWIIEQTPDAFYCSK